MLARELKIQLSSQVINAGFPIITFPLLLTRLGPESFAHFAIITGLSTYFAYLIELGFNNVGITKITNSSSKSESKKIFSEILALKLAIGILIATPFYHLTSHYLNTIDNHSTPLIFSTALPLLSCITYPAWFYIAIKKNLYNLAIQFLTKILIFLFVFIYVDNKEDWVTAVHIYSLTGFLVSLPFALTWAKEVIAPRDFYLSKASYALTLSASLKSCGISMRDAWNSNGISPILGIFSFSINISNFVVAEKIVRLITMAAPQFAAILLAHKVEASVFLKKVNKLIIYFFILFAAAIYSTSLFSKSRMARAP